MGEPEGGGAVEGELGLQGIEGREFALGAQVGDEVQGELGAVKVAVEADEVGFDSGGGAVGTDRGACADINHRSVAASVSGQRLDGIDATGGNEFTAKCGDDISRGEPDCAADGLPVSHLAHQAVAAPEQGVGALYVVV